MRLRDEAIGALNLFGTIDSRFEPDEVRVVQALADVATIAILQERNVTHAEALTEQLQGALNSRIVIEQAKGALARSKGISIGAPSTLCVSKPGSSSPTSGRRRAGRPRRPRARPRDAGRPRAAARLTA